MTPEQTELAKRLAAHQRFEWLSGMWSFGPHGWRWLVVPHPRDAVEVVFLGQDMEWHVVGSDDLERIPDLGAFSTIGVLLGMLVEAYSRFGTEAADSAIESMNAWMDGDTGSTVVHLLLYEWGDP